MSDQIVKALLESLTPEQKEELIKGLLNSNVKGDAPQLASENTVPESELNKSEVNEDFTMNRSAVNNKKRKTPVKARKNKWTDSGESRDEGYDPSKFEKMGRTKRRAKHKRKEIECHVCGKSFAINENLVFGEFIRCNRCTGR